MRIAVLAGLVAFVLTLAGCGGEEQAEAPAPFALTESAIGRYCGMNVLEHPGPKGQIILAKALEPIWFSSARDTVAFTLLPEESKNIAAIYVSDMAAAVTWDAPGVENWIDARQPFFVIGSSMSGGMGAPETVPFSTEVAARRFVEDNGGEIVGFADIPPDYVLGSAPNEIESNK